MCCDGAQLYICLSIPLYTKTYITYQVAKIVMSLLEVQLKSSLKLLQKEKI